MKDAQWGRRGELGSGIGNCKLVGLILAELLHGLAAVVGVNGKGWAGIGWFVFEEHSRLLGKLGNKPLYPAFQRCLLKTCDRNGKELIDRQLASPKLNRGRHGHEVELALPLCCSSRCK